MGINQTQIDYKWQSSYRKLIKLRSMHPRDYFNETINGNPNPMYSWCNAQRRNKARLSPKHLFQLQQIDFPWVLESRQRTKIDKWEENYLKLEELKSDFPDNWLDEIINEEPNPMFDWIQIQKKTKNKLSQDKIDKLDELEFYWTNEEEENLAKWYKELLVYTTFMDENATDIIKIPKIRKNSVLDKWCTYQREHKEELSEEQINKLNEINFEWRNSEVVKNEEWDQNYEDLSNYILTHNNALPPETEEDSRMLYLKFWYKYQLVNKPSLTELQLEKLLLLKNRNKKKEIISELELEF